jgi:hypothetical protein
MTATADSCTASAFAWPEGQLGVKSESDRLQSCQVGSRHWEDLEIVG